MSDPAVPLTPGVKPGYKTSEFWLSLVSVLAGAIAASGAFPDESGVMRVVGLITAALGAMGYSASRTFAKK